MDTIIHIYKVILSSEIAFFAAKYYRYLQIECAEKVITGERYNLQARF